MPGGGCISGMGIPRGFLEDGRDGMAGGSVDLCGDTMCFESNRRGQAEEIISERIVMRKTGIEGNLMPGSSFPAACL